MKKILIWVGTALLLAGCTSGGGPADDRPVVGSPAPTPSVSGPVAAGPAVPGEAKATAPSTATPAVGAATPATVTAAPVVQKAVEGVLTGSGSSLVAEVLQPPLEGSPLAAHRPITLQVRMPGPVESAPVLARAPVTGNEITGLDLVDFSGEGQPLILVQSRYQAVSDWAAYVSFFWFDGNSLVLLKEFSSWAGVSSLRETDGRRVVELSGFITPPFSEQYRPYDLTCTACPKPVQTRTIGWEHGEVKVLATKTSRLATSPFGSKYAGGPVAAEAIALYEQGEALLADGKAAEALPLLKAAVDKSAEYPEAWNDLSYAYAMLPQWKESRDAARQAVSMNPWIAAAQYNLGVASLHLGDARTAERALFIATALEEERWEPHYRLGQAYAASGQPDKAAAEFRRALALAPDQAEVRSAAAGDPAARTVQVPGPTWAELRASPFRFQLHAADGAVVQGYLYAPDEGSSVAPEPGSCFAPTGTRVWSGHYSLYLDRPGDGPPEAEEAFRNGVDRQWSGARLSRDVRTIAFTGGRIPDLLVIQVYAGCNGSDAAIYGLSPDDRRLVKYNWVLPKGLGGSLYVESIQVVGPDRIRTSAYFNGTGERVVKEWVADPSTATLTEVKVDQTVTH